jgi:nucleotide-binding universal stress UspA family protein
MERKKILAQFVDENLSDAAIGLEVFEDVEAGAAYKKIIDRARRENSDLIVITTHGKTGLLDALIGSVAELVIRLAPCPVLSVHPAMRQQNVEPKAA